MSRPPAYVVQTLILPRKSILPARRDPFYGRPGSGCNLDVLKVSMFSVYALKVVRESPKEIDMLVKPEEVGLSSGRLGRISDHLRRYIDAGKLAGTLTLVARLENIAYFEPLGHLEIDRKRPDPPKSLSLL